MLGFWQWSASDLVSNATRGVLAEFIVASALGIPLDGVRDEWGAFDLTTPDGVSVEVKSAAYIQSWHQSGYSKITFGVRPTRGWDANTNVQEKEARRQAQVYVFALLAHKDQATLDPLDIAQWEFYVVPTLFLDQRERSQHSITLPSLQKLVGPPVSYTGLAEAVKKASGRSA